MRDPEQGPGFRTRKAALAGLVVAVVCLAIPVLLPTAQAQEAPPCNGLQQLLGLCTTTPTTAPSTPPCNGLQKLLGMCPTTTTAPTTTSTTAPTTTTTQPPTTTTTPTAEGCQPVPKAGGGTWSCVWADEFDGTELNREFWTPQTTAETNSDSNDQDCWVDSPDNIDVSNGVLTLTSRMEAAPFTCQDRKDGPRTTQYTSATVQTMNKVSVHRGRVEIRAKVTSKNKGTHGALWMWPQDLLGNEIDIAEMYGNWPDRVIPYLHYPLYFLDGQSTNNFCMVDDYADWNTYVLEWTPQSLTVLYNGEVCIRSTMAASYFNEPYMLVISQMLGFPGNDFEPDMTPLPAHTIVDYIRVYE